MNHKIEKRKYIAVTVKLISPLAVSSGENLYSDADVQRNGDGEVFVPGTSLAGAFRNILEKCGCSESVMGYSKDNEAGKDKDGKDREAGKASKDGKGRMSPLFISDLYFEEQENHRITVSIRDRVQLKATKEVNNKFDTEIIEPGIQGTLFLNYIERQGEQTDYEGAVNTILQEIQSGAIRIGANKNRGFGRFRILKIFEREFTKDNVEEWITFVPASKDCSAYGEGIPYEKWVESRAPIETGYLKIQIPLQLTGGISIRRYSTKPEMPDFEHITCGTDDEGKPVPVIPGTSWNGAIRSDAVSILAELVKKEKAERYIRGWFGHVKEKGKKSEKPDVQQPTEETKKNEMKRDAWQSTVVIGESRIKGGAWQTVTRNQINRFDASTKAGALYTEQAYFGGDTTLELMVHKEENYEALVGLLLMVLFDLQEGYISVGGQTAIGRGIFEMRGEIKLDSHEITEKEKENYNRALYNFLYEQKEVV